MKTIPPSTALIEFIKTSHSEYYGKICELREAIEGWLAYVPQTFPHYTRHTITHSDTIISQISKLLFQNDDPSKPIIRLSGVEAYILVAAAYLHDAGMVTSDTEKTEILMSDSWKNWTSGSGGGANRWKNIQDLRDGNVEPKIEDSTIRNFIADIQTRFLIAEFIRMQHHLRAGSVIEVHSDELGRMDFGDHMLRKAIAQVCIGHGLGRQELDDKERFPDLRDIREESVNLRFLAILLRLGDLLDMSVDRACPLIFSAASPLPPDSFPHWEQYKAIVHRSTSPQAIEVTAECQNQEIHRVLQDWCQWIVDEINYAKLVIPKCQRHSDWQIPDATIETNNPTIIIRRAENATYIPSKWTLQFDQQAIFERLSENLYGNQLDFIRELIQNGLDALRCQMYFDLVKEGKETPEYPTQVDEEFRNRYKLSLSISNIEVVNKMSGESESRQLMIIEDNGIGMDSDIIQKYFLQVGRSYYTSDEFQRKFHFSPTSRFRIGFLSVFSVSDNVKVETYKPTSELKDNEPISITLSGFRNYLLREKSDRKNSGTRIEILLRNNINSGDLLNFVESNCKRVEFPIYVSDFENKKTIYSEKPEDFIYEQPLATNPDAKFVMRAFPINRAGIEGEFYILALVNKEGESWADLSWANNTYPTLHPLAIKPKAVGSLECLHGVAINKTGGFFFSGSGQLNYKVDFRNSKFLPTLNRSEIRYRRSRFPKEFESRWEELLTEHLKTSSIATSTDSWKYKQQLADNFPLTSFWDSIPDMFKVYQNDTYKTISFDELISNEEIIIVMQNIKVYWTKNPHNKVDKQMAQLKTNSPIISVLDKKYISNHFLSKIFSEYKIDSIQFLEEDYLGVSWKKGDIVENYTEMDAGHFSTHKVIVKELSESKLITLKLHSTTTHSSEIIIFNKKNEFIQWLIQVEKTCNESQLGFSNKTFEMLANLVKECSWLGSTKIENLEKYISDWRKIPNLPDELYPPNIELTKDVFR